MKRLIAELNDFLAANAVEFSQVKRSAQRDYIIRKLSPENSAVYASLPEGVARQLTLDRDPHGNVQVSLIETEKLLSEMVATKLAQWKEEGKYTGKFAAQHHFFGLYGRRSDRQRQDGLHVVRSQYDRSCRPMDCRRCAHHNDDEHGASPRRDEAGYSESFGETGWRAVQDICRSA